MILTILPSTDKATFDAFDAAGARNAPQPGVKGLFRRPIEPMLHVRHVRFPADPSAGQ